MANHASLLEATARGDQAAFQQLYEAEASFMLGIAKRILRRTDLAEEAMHDAFVQVWRKSGQFDASRGSARGWMVTIVRNRAIDLLRSGHREEVSDPETVIALAEKEAGGEIAALDQAWARLEHRSRLRSCLEGLDPTRRRAILLAYVLGLTHGEIAGRLGAPLGTVKAWVRRGLLALRECMT